ncbi:Uncharacterized conserved protein, DUF885 familyt [Chitinophaga sp. YR573]|uniref:DUF885 domain-containing protein n=1 Tax=Chitinophaga sp. YR573 TaxID=1881040 RepID=UPI0008B79992|nr:DUF885 domain-containing protein [Chitinophaga sp. YR573]SEW02904.1 Uncharacterized conserved protein, DUF885 familyt [Chitinophaga sp. YR573]
MSVTKNRLLLLAFTLSFAACTNMAKQSGNGTDSLHHIVQHYYDEKMLLFPLDATVNGEHQYDGLMQIDISEHFRQRLDSFYTRYQQSLQGIDTASLAPNDLISYLMLLREVSVGKEGLRFPDNLMPFQQFWGMTLTLPQLGSGTGAQPFKNKDDYEKFIHRMKTFAEWTDTAIVNMRKGMATGYVLPKTLVVKMIPQMADLSKKDTGNVFYSPLKTLPTDLDSNARVQLKDEYTATIEQYVLPSYAKLKQFLQTEYLAKARTSSGLDSLPNGKEWYAYLIRSWTTTSLTPDEIFAIGEKEVARIRGEMETVKTSTGFKGDLPAFFNFLRTDKQFKIFSTPGQVLDSFRAIKDKIMPKVEQMYGHLPKTGFEVRQTEAFRAASASAEYMQGSADGTRPGVFYVPILNPKEFGYTGMECLFLHEAIPGHHFQISIQQENDSLPKFRRFNWIGAYGEGYALYCESLGKELGLYTNPYMYVGRLGDEIHRAIRLVVDVGLHSKGWTREQAIKYMLDNEPTSEQEATAEIERYMAIPAQALSYKIGEMKIRELRNKYAQQLGSKFNIKDFHDELLSDGCVPLSVLEEKMARRFK